MARWALRSTLTATSVVLGLALTPATAATAGAAPADAAAFGQHVRECAQSTGFDRDHNPGMHLGLSGWDPEHPC